MNDCIFCKIANGEIPTNMIYTDDICTLFYDADPKAPVHFLAVPKEHITGADKIDSANEGTVGHIFSVIAQTAAKLGLGNGYRVVTNVGKDGGQTVGHLHFHVLAGRELAWPPG
jgi:histidine triad (HIT) family protein